MLTTGRIHLTLLSGLKAFSKKVPSFVNFDVEIFYPSILSFKRFTDSIEYAKNLIEITDEDLTQELPQHRTID